MAKPSTADRFMPAVLDALRAFPVAPGEITLMAHAENLTFRVTNASDGAVYALRLHRPGYNSLEELQAEQLWVQALAEAGISVPTAVLARDGRSHVLTFNPTLDESRFASMTRWQPGRLLSSILDGADDPTVVASYLLKLGFMTAKMHDQACGWSPPLRFKRRILDLDALIGDKPVWGRFEDHPSLSADERRLLLETRDRIRDALGAHVPNPATFGLIHADLHPKNVIVDGDSLCILDFDDAAFGSHLYDIAVGLFYLQAKAHFDQTQQAYLTGYRAIRGLDDADVALLPFFRLARGLMMIGWFEQRPKLAQSSAFLTLKDQVLNQCSIAAGEGFRFTL